MSNDVRAATTYPAIVGRILEHQRSIMGMSQKAVADGMQLSQGAWSRVESGSSVISLDQLHKAAVLLETTPASLLALADSAEKQLKSQGIELVTPRSTTTGSAVMTGAALGALLAAILLRKS